MPSNTSGRIQPVPIVTVGGFLGAGKTTLVNQLLSQSDGKRIVVFVNDFGAINIDHDLIETADTDRISLTNGCVCCSLNDDLIASISTFCQTSPPDAFVVEASGVADPRALDQSIAALQYAEYIQLTCRVYVVDVDQFGELEYADIEQIVDHAVASDLTLLNKWDLADRTKVDTVENLIERSAPQTILRRTTYCNVSLCELLNEISSSSVLSAAQGSSHATSISDYTSWSWEKFAPISRGTFCNLLKALNHTTIRAKGTLYFDDSPDIAFKFDWVGNKHSLSAMPRNGRPPAPRFVAIGYSEKLSKAELSKHFSGCEYGHQM